ELITDQQLTVALETQKRTQQRLGDLLISSKYIAPDRFRQMMQLQASETLYKLFSWKSGTYQFQQQDVEVDGEGLLPLRAESVLMEGFRMVDEWPEIRKKITSYEMKFEKLKDLGPPSSAESGGEGGDFKSIGDSERIVFGLIKPQHDVRKLIDISCLGEFETCKSLCNLVNLDYLRPVVPAGKASVLGLGGGQGGGLRLDRLSGYVGRIAAVLVVLALLGFIGLRVNTGGLGMARRPSASFEDPATQRFISSAQLARIEAALDVYRLEKGEVPKSLDALVEAGLLADGDLRYPWRDAYYYRRVAPREFVLLPPLR
ncbi:MAG: DUF4388 domain-containing protein, partial [Myxococcaceae bacterium]